MTVTYRLHWLKTFALIFIYLFAMLITADAVLKDDWTNADSLIAWFLMFGVIPTLALIHQLNSTQRTIEAILGVAP